MKFCETLKALTVFIGVVHALPAALPADYTEEELIKLAQGIPSGSGIKKRAACNADNALRLLRDKRWSSSASEFCSVFIQATVTDLLSVGATVTTVTTEAAPPTTVTVTEAVTVTAPETITETSYIPTTGLPTQTLKKRASLTYPPWLSTEYPSSRVSSACSCFITAIPVTHVTETVVTETVTKFSETVTLPPDVVTATELSTTTETPIVVVPKTIICGLSPACRDQSDIVGYYSSTTREECLTYCAQTEGCLSIQWGRASPVEGACFLGERSVEETYSPINSQSPVCVSWFMDSPECIHVI